MTQCQLSILIPARNEMFTKRTIEDLLEHIEADTEIIVGLDGEWSNPGIPQHERVNVIYYNQSIGQRAMTNQCAKLARGRYLAKLDAHCSFDQGFDRKMIEAFEKEGDNCIIVPTMRNLHAFDWKCYKCGWKKYQGPTPTECPDCGNKDPKYIRRKMIWKGKEKPQSNSYCFDSEPHFQYFNEYTKREDYKDGDIVETMSLQGSFFMCTAERYWALKLSDEVFGSWGSQGIELACKMWLSGGRVLVNKDTWYAHMFRTQGGDFSFPYPQSGKQVDSAKKLAKKMFFNSKFEGQILPLSWLINKFSPVKGWDDKALEELGAAENNIWQIQNQ